MRDFPNIQALTKEQGGEHRQITVMFCDLVESTQLSNQVDSEDLRELLREYQVICAKAIESRGGMIAVYLGDGIHAYFGYPRAMEDATIHAAEAALEICRDVAKMGRRLKDERQIHFAMRLALHTGRVLISEMGAGETRDHHAMTGVVPNMAARMEQFAPENSIVVSEQTLSLISKAFRSESIGFKELKGFPKPVEIFHLLGSLSPASTLPEPTRALEGRDEELKILHEAWERTQAGESVRTTIVAEPGAGKSVLASAFIAREGIERRRIIEFAGSIATRHSPICQSETDNRQLGWSQR